MIRFLNNSEKSSTKELYELVFHDTKQFMEYYYDQRILKNRVLVLEEAGQIRAMLHLNPHTICFEQKNLDLDYIYAVATHPNYRRMGYMGKLLGYAFDVMREEGKLFTYLIPEDANVYKKYGFQFVYSKVEDMPYNRSVIRKNVKIRRASQEDIAKMAEFCTILNEMYDIYTLKDETYFKMVLQQIEAEQGYIELMSTENQLVGIRFINGEGEPSVIEEVVLSGYETIPAGTARKPLIMVKELQKGILQKFNDKNILINEQV